MGFMGLGLSVVCYLFVKEPAWGSTAVKKVEETPEAAEKKTFMEKAKSCFVDIWQAPTTRNIALAAMFRKFGEMAITSYLPSYLMALHPDRKVEYAAINTVVLSFCGFTSNMIGGRISDVGERYTYMTKSYICVFSAIISVPCVILIAYPHHNFYASMTGVGFYIFINGSYNAAAQTMLQNSVANKDVGKILASYYLYNGVAHTMSPIVMGWLGNMFDAKHNP